MAEPVAQALAQVRELVLGELGRSFAGLFDGRVVQYGSTAGYIRADGGGDGLDGEPAQPAIAVILAHAVQKAADLFARFVNRLDGCMILLEDSGFFVQGDGPLGAEEAEVLGRVDLLAWGRVEEAALAFDGELPIDDGADGEVATVLEGDGAVVAQQGAFAEAAAAVEQDDEALQFVVGGRSCLDRGVEVGI